MLIYFEPAAMCDLQRDLAIGPLPGRKQLWEAIDAPTWQAATAQTQNMQTAFALARNGELVQLEGGQRVCRNGVMSYKHLSNQDASANAANWQEWCSGMDGLGGLIMLAASLLT